MKPRDRSLGEWLDFLENRHAQEIKLGLSLLHTVAARLDVLHVCPVVITVAGTNGKGSTVAALEAIYCAAGYRVGAYTSPHILAFNERIRVNQCNIDDERLCQIFATIEDARGDVLLRYFEMATLAALLYFKQSALDVVILEVGMGGRMDATNVINADLAIITTVDLDHQDYLGHTKEAIGYEKAGILRAHTPCIYADYDPPMSVLNHAVSLSANMQCLGRDYTFTTTVDALTITPKVGATMSLPLPGINPKAAAAAIIASDCLSTVLPVTHAERCMAMEAVAIVGRQQVVEGPVTTVFDVAHNPQSVSLLAEFLKQRRQTGDIHAVFSGLKDKDLCGLIRPMRFMVHYWYPTVLSGKRAATDAMITEAFQTEKVAVSTCFSNPMAAYRAACTRAKSGDLIVVYGSFLMVSGIMGHNEEQV